MPNDRSPEILANRDARRLLLERQGLCRPPRRKLAAVGLQTLIEDLGYVQLDSISTVARAHHMILFARNETYRPELLARLIERDRSLFENWTHDAAVIPTAFFPYWQHRFAREKEALRARWQKWRRDGFLDAMDKVLTHVTTEGPTRARDLTPKNDGTKKSAESSWWDWHPAKTALEYHWRCGALSVCRREGFQKVYDLTDRVIPEAHRGPPPDLAAFRDWACREALARLGIASSGEIAGFWHLVSPKEAASWCKDKLASGDLMELLIAPADKGKPRPAYALPGTLEEIHDLPPAPPRIRALSPFDPAIRNRQRLERIFGFDYRIEVFVPAAKRRYGYYVFPLLEGERLIGRIDMKHDKQADALKVSSLWLEPKVRLTPARQGRLEAELDRQRRFIGAAHLRFNDGYVKSDKS